VSILLVPVDCPQAIGKPKVDPIVPRAGALKPGLGFPLNLPSSAACAPGRRCREVTPPRPSDVMHPGRRAWGNRGIGHVGHGFARTGDKTRGYDLTKAAEEGLGVRVAASDFGGSKMLAFGYCFYCIPSRDGMRIRPAIAR